MFFNVRLNLVLKYTEWLKIMNRIISLVPAKIETWTKSILYKLASYIYRMSQKSGTIYRIFKKIIKCDLPYGTIHIFLWFS